MKIKYLPIITALAVAGCTTTSPTGRSQLTLYPAEKLNAMGKSTFDEMKQTQAVSTHRATNQYVQCVADAITRKVSPNVHQGEWEVVVFDDEAINAFALPGGKIGVYTGILHVAEDDDQLAAIIGHEVGHVIAQHSNERMTHSAAAGVGMSVAAMVLKDQKIDHSDKWIAALGVGVQYGILMPYSRTHESEADNIGQTLMAEAGFNPAASVKLWHNMAAANDGKAPMEFMSTHPATSTRISALTRQLDQTNPIYNTAKKSHCNKPDIPTPKKRAKPEKAPSENTRSS